MVEARRKLLDSSARRVPRLGGHHKNVHVLRAPVLPGGRADCRSPRRHCEAPGNHGAWPAGEGPLVSDAACPGLAFGFSAPLGQLAEELHDGPALLGRGQLLAAGWKCPHTRRQVRPGENLAWKRIQVHPGRRNRERRDQLPAGPPVRAADHHPMPRRDEMLLLARIELDEQVEKVVESRQGFLCG